MIRYVPADHNDVEQMYRLDMLCFEPPFRFARSTFDYLMSNPDVIAIKAVDDGRGLVGFIVLEPEPPELACVATIDVHPHARREGIGGELMRRVADAARAIGLSKVYLHVYVGNTSAQEFYRGLGYESRQLLPSFYGPGRHAYLMVLADVAAERAGNVV
ncbi:MAG: GNAT family N-acetyltransferase [Deltaproteobacteria bacterium]|nr:GNAT family N-acetyltransferase [Deltaproteobacteria bacterium]